MTCWNAPALRNADGLAAVTNSDTLNVVVAHAARPSTMCPVVICRNYDPHLRGMLEAFGLQMVSSTSWGAQRTEELLTSVLSRGRVLGGQRRSGNL